VIRFFNAFCCGMMTLFAVQEILLREWDFMHLPTSVILFSLNLSSYLMLSPAPRDNGATYSDAAGEPRLIESESP
jgi:hypothetical protein